MKRQSGFTLVEIAIVLVVIGLLLGGVLKGQELVLNARIRNAINEYNSIASASFAYQDRYRAIPGDDNGAAARWDQIEADDQGNGNGRVEGDNDYSTGGTTGEETSFFWQHLRNDRLVTGDLASQDLPLNSFDGRTGVHGTGVFGGVPPNGIPGMVICHSNIPFKGATIIDTRIDDGTGNTGTLMAAGDDGALDSIPDNSEDYSQDNAQYVMCREL